MVVVTAVDDIRDLGDLLAAAEKALADEKADHANTLAELNWWMGVADKAEDDLTDLEFVLRDLRVRNAELERLYAREVSAAASARSELASVRAQLDATRGNR